jgi:hypothetical protein
VAFFFLISSDIYIIANEKEFSICDSRVAGEVVEKVEIWWRFLVRGQE